MLRRALQFVAAAAIVVALPAYSQSADLSFVGDLMPTLQENAGAATFSIKRTGDLTSTVSAQLSSEFWHSSPGPMPLGTPSITTVTFAPNETLKTFTVPILNDNIWSYERYAAIVLRNPSPNATLGGRGQGAPHWIWAKIQEDEPIPSLIVSDVTLAELNAGRRSGAFTVSVSPGIGTDETAGYSLYLQAWYGFVDNTAKRGIDYDGTDGSLLFDATHSQITVPFEIIGNTTYEPQKSFKLRFFSVTVGTSVPPPPDATCTILNDDVELKPSNARITRGSTVKFSLDIGLPAASLFEIPLRASDPSILSLPPSVRFNPGQSIATFSATASAAGSSKLSLTLPVEKGGETLSASIIVFESGTVVFEPTAVTAFIAEESTVHLSLRPASSQAELLRLTSGNESIATVPEDVLVPAGGSGTFKVKGIAPGATYITAFLPETFGSGYATATLDVIDKPPTPAITAIEPPSGSANGGTPFIARGSLLTADCMLLFGGTPAIKYTLTSEGHVLGATPPHAPGTIDVTLQCGSNTFVLTKAFTFVGVPRTRSARH